MNGDYKKHIEDLSDNKWNALFPKGKNVPVCSVCGEKIKVGLQQTTDGGDHIGYRDCIIALRERIDTLPTYGSIYRGR